MRSYKRGRGQGNNNYSYSSIRPSNNKGKIVVLLVILLLAAFAFFFANTLFGGKIPFMPATITFDDSLTEGEVAFIKDTLGDRELLANITIKAADSTSAPTAADENTIIYDVFLPTTDFYDARSNVSSGDEFTYTSIKDLKPANKVLSLDGNYYFDTFSRGAKFRTLTFESQNAGDIPSTIKKRLNLPTKDTTLSLMQTGVTALTRGMIDVLNQQDGDATYFSKNLKDFMSKADYTHMSNEVSFADNCSVTRTSTTLCSPTNMLDIIKDLDLDIIELTGNHNNDYSAEANLATIDTYLGLGIETFGGGKNAASAAKPYEISSKNSKVTLLGYNYSTSTVANGQGASEDYPGANIYNEDTAKSDIEKAKQAGDFVIVDIQYFECYSYPEDGGEYPQCDYPITGQEEFFHHLIDLGADMVVGTQAHQPQTYELYNGKPIYYGLGNLFFDQTYWPGTTRGYILTHYFHNGEYLQTRITPHQYDDTYQTKLMDEETSKWFLDRLADARTAQ